MTNPIDQIHRLGQSFWYDNIRRGLIKSGELQRLIDMGVSGLTSNPTIFEKAIAGSTDYDDSLLSSPEPAKGRTTSTSSSLWMTSAPPQTCSAQYTSRRVERTGTPPLSRVRIWPR